MINLTLTPNPIVKVDTPYSLLSGSLHLASGLCCGLCSLASGYAIGIIGEAGVRGMIKQPKVLVGFVLLLIFAEVLGLYGLITGVIINLAATQQT